MEIDKEVNIETYKEEKKEEKQEQPKESFEELDLDFLADVEYKAAVEVGRVKKFFYDILKMKEGDIIQLDKNIEDYIDIYIQNQKFAIGEMVVVNDKYAVRVVDLAG